MTPDVPRLREVAAQAERATRVLSGEAHLVAVVLKNLADALLSDAPPDGAAEREAEPTLVERRVRATAAAYAAGREPGPLAYDEAEYGTYTPRPQPTPARTEAPTAKRDGVRDEAFFVWETLATPERPIDLRSFRAGWNAALAARPAAVTDAMVERYCESRWGARWHEMLHPHQAHYRANAHVDLTAALAARGPA